MNTLRQAKSVNQLVRLVTVLVVSALTSSLAANVFAATASLSWNAPTNYTDGTPATGLGYIIYTGSTSGNYSETLDVGNVTSYTVSNLGDSTTYYFVVKAYDTTGNSSGYSNQVSYTTPTPPPTAYYTISAAAGSGGSITPSGSVAISKGLSQTFAITPNSGYTIAGVTVDGAAVGAVPSYTISNVTANHTLSATFTSTAFGSPTCANPPVRLSGTTAVYYPDLSSAYTAVVDSNTVQLQALNFNGDLLLNRDLSITLEGGYDCGYTANAGATGLQGMMRVVNGTVNVENLRFI